MLTEWYLSVDREDTERYVYACKPSIRIMWRPWQLQGCRVITVSILRERRVAKFAGRELLDGKQGAVFPWAFLQEAKPSFDWIWG